MPIDLTGRYSHLFTSNSPISHPYRSPLSARGQFRQTPRNRAAHATHLKNQLERISDVADARTIEQKEAGIDSGYGITLQFESEPNFDLKFESLDISRSGIELLNVKRLPNGRTIATVFVPDGKLSILLKRIDAYERENTKPNTAGETRPKNEDLVAGISSIRIAAIQALWTDINTPLPDIDENVTWEVWLRKSGSINHLDRLRERAAEFDLTLSENSIEFIDRIIVLVHGTGTNISRSNDLLGSMAELRLAKTTADMFLDMPTIEQQQWIQDLIQRVTPPMQDAPSVCLLDTGLNRAHPLISPIVAENNLHTHKPAWGFHDNEGHGTQMAGLAIYGDLVEVFTANTPVQVSHQIESVKMFNSTDQHSKELYGAVTSESVSRVEIEQERSRIYCMAITTSDDRDRGDPSSWSAAIDDLTSGRNDSVRRLMIVSAGNTSNRRDYPDSNMTDNIHDPAQAWNALTVGGYTEKSIIDQVQYPGWEPLASAGDLAPASCTSMTWKGKHWPIKPDIVLEAGNMAKHPEHDEPDYIDPSLDLLTTSHDFNTGRLLRTFGDTSAASALAARLAGMLWAKYPNLTPESIRALMVHSAHWTPTMLARFTNTNGFIDYEGLVRCFGFGTPNVQQLLTSASNSLTLIAQESILPFHKEGSNVLPREMKLHALPWPNEELSNLLETPVTMRITLSYFIEPNPGSRGWTTKFGYQSHGLRFFVKRARESSEAFIKRINKAVRETNYDSDHFEETGEWLFKGNSRLRSLGSLRSNTWTGTAADLAARGEIAVVPTYGWWNKRPNLEGYEKECSYSLAVSITTPETDIYTPVATQIGVPIEIEN